MSQWSDQPFQPLSVPIPGGEGRRAVARFVCSSCDAKEEFVIGSGKLIPEMVVKKAAASGWDVREGKVRCRCPRCAKSAKARGERPGPKIIAPANVVITQVATEVDTTPSVAKRFKVIDLLENSFDRKSGSYRMGLGDQEIAKAASVPVETVIKIREDLFGPLIAPSAPAESDKVGLKREFEAEMLRIDAQFERFERELASLREQAERTQATFLARLWALEVKGKH